MIEDYPKTLEQLREEQEKIKSRHQENSITELPPAYAKKLRQQESTRTLAAILGRVDNLTHRPQKHIQQFMSYEDARVIVWRICQQKSGLIGRDFEVDESNRAIIQNLIRYFIGDPACEWVLSKGLFLMGEVGLGKTYLMSVMQTFVDASNIEYRKFKFKICNDIVDEVLNKDDKDPEQSGTNALQKYFSSEHDICFDDLGQEPSVVQWYGNTLSVMERILVKRYSNFVNGKCITHITTNLTPDDIETVYGTRLSDRFNEMFNIVPFPGKSRRR